MIRFTSDVQLLSVIVSVLAIAWAMVAFQKARTISKHRQQKDRSFCGKVIHFIRGTLYLFLWRCCTIGSRVIVFALVWIVPVSTWSSSTWKIIYIACAVFLILVPGMLSFVLPLDVKPSTIDAFFFVNILDIHYNCSGHSRNHATVYYCVVFVLTSITMGMWYVEGILKDDITVVFLSILASVLFFVGIVFMTLHYSCCHENKKNIRKWVPCNKMHLRGKIKDISKRIGLNICILISHLYLCFLIFWFIIQLVYSIQG